MMKMVRITMRQRVLRGKAMMEREMLRWQMKVRPHI
jgi:hypothetical protein